MLAPEDIKTSDWYLAYTKSRQEEIARVNLDQQEFETYLPLYKKFKKTAQGPVSVFEPMFPRYIFFRPGQAKPGRAFRRSAAPKASPPSCVLVLNLR